MPRAPTEIMSKSARIQKASLPPPVDPAHSATYRVVRLGRHDGHGFSGHGIRTGDPDGDRVVTGHPGLRRLQSLGQRPGPDRGRLRAATWLYGPGPQAVVPTCRKIYTVSFTTTDPMCPQCGGDLRRSRSHPHGSDTNGVVYMARECRGEEMWFGRAVDGSWSVSVTPLNMN